jgi:phosphate transport system permease protein
MRERHTIREAAVTAAVWLSGLVVTAVFFWLLIDLLVRGLGPLTWEFLTTEPQDMGRRGGILPIIISTLLILAVCMAVTVPLGLGTAVFLSEYTSERRFFGRTIRRSLDVLAAVPSVVFGLFGSALFCRYMGMGYSILAGGLTLACMVLPIFIRAAEQGMRAVPHDLRLGAAGLGLSRWSTLTKVLIPSAMPMLIAAFVLGIGRALAETAALIFTSGVVTRMPESLMESGRAMSVHIYELSMGVAGADRNAYACALVLVGLLLLINLIAVWVGERSRKAWTNET